MTSMAQLFLLSKAAKTLSLAQVFRMSDEKAEEMFRLIRGPRQKALRFARIAAALTLMIAAVRMVRRVFAAALAARISA